MRRTLAFLKAKDAKALAGAKGIVTLRGWNMLGGTNDDDDGERMDSLISAVRYSFVTPGCNVMLLLNHGEVMHESCFFFALPPSS